MRKHSSEDKKDKARASKNFAEIGVAGAARGEKIESLMERNLWQGNRDVLHEQRC